MTGGQYETIPIAPDWMVRVETHFLPDRIHHRRECHGGTRMAGVGGLYGVHAERTDRVDRELLNRIALQGGEVCGGLGHGQPSSVHDPHLQVAVNRSS